MNNHCLQKHTTHKIALVVREIIKFSPYIIICYKSKITLTDCIVSCWLVCWPYDELIWLSVRLCDNCAPGALLCELLEPTLLVDAHSLISPLPFCRQKKNCITSILICLKWHSITTNTRQFIQFLCIFIQMYVFQIYFKFTMVK